MKSFVRFGTRIGSRRSRSSGDVISQGSLLEQQRAELEALLAGPDPIEALRTARDDARLIALLPEFGPCLHYDQRTRFHGLPADEHMFLVAAQAASRGASMDVRLAALLHDVGKPHAAFLGTDGFYHYGGCDSVASHEEIGAAITLSALLRLGYGTMRADRVARMVRWHMPREATLAEAREVARVMAGATADLCLLRRCDAYGKGAAPERSSLRRLDLLEAAHDPLALAA